MFFKAVIFGSGLYIGWNLTNGVLTAIYKKANAKFNSTKCIETKTVKRTIGFNSKWEES